MDLYKVLHNRIIKYSVESIAKSVFLLQELGKFSGFKFTNV